MRRSTPKYSFLRRRRQGVIGNDGGRSERHPFTDEDTEWILRKTKSPNSSLGTADGCRARSGRGSDRNGGGYRSGSGSVRSEDDSRGSSSAHSSNDENSHDNCDDENGSRLFPRDMGSEDGTAQAPVRDVHLNTRSHVSIWDVGGTGSEWSALGQGKDLLFSDDEGEDDDDDVEDGDDDDVNDEDDEDDLECAEASSSDGEAGSEESHTPSASLRSQSSHAVNAKDVDIRPPPPPSRTGSASGDGDRPSGGGKTLYHWKRREDRHQTEAASKAKEE